MPRSAPALSRSVLDLCPLDSRIRGVSVESEAGSLSVDPPLPDLVFLRLVSLNRSFYGYDFQFHRAFLPSSVFPRSSDLFDPAKRTVRYLPGGRSASGGQSGQDQSDGPLLFISNADRSWRTVYSEPFLSVPGTF